MATRAYAGFDHPAIAPLRQFGRDDWLLELFHGPTLAFKDFAMQLLAPCSTGSWTGGRAGDDRRRHLGRHRGRGRRTPSPASAQVRIAMLHPEGRVSPVQRRQMTTVPTPNVLNIAVRGTFDDCQDLVKAMFADVAFRHALRLTAVNSINWARVVTQAVYYVWAALRLGAPDRAVAFACPPAISATSMPAGSPRRSGCRSRG